MNGHVFPNRKYYKNRGQLCGFLNKKAQNRSFSKRGSRTYLAVPAHIYIWIANEDAKTPLRMGFEGSEKVLYKLLFF